MVTIASNDLASSNPLEGTFEEQGIEEDKEINIQIGIGIPETVYNVGT